MRKRMIDPGFWNDSKVIKLSIPARLLYVGLWQYADDEGFFLDDIPAIKRTLFPDQKFDVQGSFTELHGFLTEYSVSPHGRAYQITHFCDWQKLNRPTPSKIKPFCTLTESSLNPHGVLTEDSLRTHSEEKRIEEKGREAGSTESDKLIPDSLFTNEEPKSDPPNSPPSSKKKKTVPRRAGIPPELQPSVSRIVGKINELAGAHYHEDRPGALKTLLARLNGGETEADCLAVVEDRWQKWGADKTMIEHFNPTTLFREENFAKYLANAQRNGNGNASSKVEFLDNDRVRVDGFTMSRADYERRYAKRQRDA